VIRGMLLSRLMLVLPTLFGVAVVVFVLLRVVPGDPIAMMIPPGASAADIDRLRALYGLDRSIAAQFGLWLSGVAGGDFGRSISLRQDVLGLVLGRLPATLELAGLAALAAVAAGAALALAGAYLRSTPGEWLIDAVVAVALGIPDFLWGLLFILVFAVLAPVLPVSGRIDPGMATGFSTNFYLIESIATGRWTVAGGLLRHAVLPAAALALPFAAIVARVLKASLAETEQQDYALMARARGFTRRRILLVEALPNAAIPTVALAGVQVTFLLGGTVLVERIFSYEGIGNMAIDAVINRDLPLIQGLVLTFALLFIALNLVVDIVVALLNPRLRRG